jgi:hypothetical protein
MQVKLKFEVNEYINVYFYYPTNTIIHLVFVVYLHVILLHVSAVQISYQKIGHGYTKSKEARRGLSLQTVGVNLL